MMPSRDTSTDVDPGAWAKSCGRGIIDVFLKQTYLHVMPAPISRNLATRVLGPINVHAHVRMELTSRPW